MPVGKADILLELDWEGRLAWRWEDPYFHHDMERLPNGNTLVITWANFPEETARRVVGGFSPERNQRIHSDPEHVKFFMGGLGVGGRPRHLGGFLSDTIFEIAPDGSRVHTWNAWEHCDPCTEHICSHEYPTEWTHANSICYRHDGKLLLSFREPSIVMVIDWPKGDVLWKWGRDRISHQHDASFTPDGNVLVFDNGTHHPIVPKSRVVEVDMRSDTIVWQYLPKVVFSFFSGHIGGCERLPNGNTFICEGQSGRLFEATPDNDVCWEWITPFILPFKGVNASMIFRAHRYAEGAPEVAGKDLDWRRHEKLNRELGLVK
jgi:hypothetical protein